MKYISYMYKIYFITLLITIAFAIINGLLYKSTKNTIICQTEYEETPNVIVNVPNLEYFHLLTFLTTLLMLP